jgi:hypothetical protein
MKTRVFVAVVAAVALSGLVITKSLKADDERLRTVFRAHMVGAHETPAISTAGSAHLVLRIDDDTQTIDFSMSYAGLEGGTIGASHVHFGQPNVAGGVSFFFCGGGSKPACPPAPATITGTVVAADVIGPKGQGIQPGDFDKIVAAIRAGLAYANMHTTQFPSGEIRGQLR